MKPMKEEHLAILRRHMVELIAILVDLSSEELGKAALDERVMAAMRRVPRHFFVPVEVAPHAYRDMPLPIGFDKTVSQPFIVALMTDLLAPPPLSPLAYAEEGPRDPRSACSGSVHSAMTETAPINRFPKLTMAFASRTGGPQSVTVSVMLCIPVAGTISGHEIGEPAHAELPGLGFADPSRRWGPRRPKRHQSNVGAAADAHAPQVGVNVDCKRRHRD